MAAYYGTDGNDQQIGTYNFLFGYDGNDYLVANKPGHARLEGGKGLDYLFATAAGPVSANGGDGADYIVGGSLGDELFGGKDNDYIFANGGADHIEGGADSDVLTGNDGDDRIYGGAGDDSGMVRTFLDWNSGNPTLTKRQAGLFGVSGNDFLHGGSGKDYLDGGADNDVLVGGRDSDELWGRGGFDVFRFDALADSRPDRALRDTIGDFETTIDLIDLSAIDARTGKAGDQRFKFIDADPFSGKQGELRYAGGTLAGDVNGDGKADFAVKLAGAAALVVDDIVL